MQPSMRDRSDKRRLRTALAIGLKGRCPRCGRGALFTGFLTLVDRCDVCLQTFKEHDAGDGPAVFGTFFVGFVALAIAVWLEFTYMPPLWVHPVVTAPLILGGSIGILRPLKGISISLQYRYRSVDEVDPHLGQM